MNKHWFRKRKGLKSKDMGYGWVPIAWEGWVSIGVFLGIIFGMMYSLGIHTANPKVNEYLFISLLLAWIIVFAFFAKSRSID